jgi:hypothetical protein
MISYFFVHNARVWSGACGINPDPGGKPNSAHGIIVNPKTKKSQWYAGGFDKLYLGDCVNILDIL